MAGQSTPQSVLDAAKAPDAIKADAFDAYFGASSPQEFQSKFDKLQLPDDVKAQLFDLKFRGGGIETKPPAERRLGADQATGITKGYSKTSDIIHQYGVHELPTIGGMVGGVVGSRFGMPVRGAMVGGALGERAKEYIDALSGRKPLPKTTREAVGKVAVAGAEQGAYELTGQAVGGLVRGPLKSAAGPEQRAALATSEKYGLNLSSPEVMKGAGRTGRLMERLQHGSMRAGLSNPTTYRRAGEANAQRFVESSLDTFASRTGTKATGEQVKAGVKLGKKGFEATTRAELDAVIKRGPSVPMADLKAEARRILDEEIAPTLQSFPALAGGKPAAGGTGGGVGMETLRDALKGARTPQQRAAIQGALQAQLDAAIQQTPNTPVGKILKEILTAEDEVSFDVAVRYRERLRLAGKTPDELLGNRARGTATHLANNLRETMAQLHPDWAVASKAYGQDAELFKRKFIRDIAKQDPEYVLNATTTRTGRTNPSRIDALRKVLLEKAKDSPDPAAGREAWNRVRRMWFDRDVLRDTNGRIDIANLGRRLDRVDADTLKAWFPDASGQTFVANAKELATALKRRIAEPNSRLYEILEFSKMGAAVATGITSGVSGGGVHGLEVAGATFAGLEAIPALLTWALFNPKMTSFLIKGLTDRDPSVAASSLFRVVGEFTKDHRVIGERTGMPPVPGAGAPATPGASTPKPSAKVSQLPPESRNALLALRHAAAIGADPMSPENVKLGEVPLGPEDVRTLLMLPKALPQLGQAARDILARSGNFGLSTASEALHAIHPSISEQRWKELLKQFGGRGEP